MIVRFGRGPASSRVGAELINCAVAVSYWARAPGDSYVGPP